MFNLDELQKKIRSLADTVNAFKSEAVQLRVIDALLNQLGLADEASPDRLLRSSSKNQSRSGTKRTKEKKPAKPRRRTKASPASPGAQAMISKLLDDGFFKSGKTISDIVEHCSSSKGHHYKPNECSPALLRLLRDQKLQRKKNEDGQYEYTQI